MFFSIAFLFINIGDNCGQCDAGKKANLRREEIVVKFVQC